MEKCLAKDVVCAGNKDGLVSEMKQRTKHNRRQKFEAADTSAVDPGSDDTVRLVRGAVRSGFNCPRRA
jgi:hypothetical protein